MNKPTFIDNLRVFGDRVGHDFDYWEEKDIYPEVKKMELEEWEHICKTMEKPYMPKGEFTYVSYVIKETRKLRRTL